VWLGDILDSRFVIERPVGHGGMATVFYALDRQAGVPVAVKWMHEEYAGWEERFAREASILSRIAHPAVVRYIASGRSGAGEPYLVMEWLSGEDLASRIRRGSLSIADSLLVVQRAAEGLACAHRLGIVHRDVKPSNLFLPKGEPARLKVVDFGIARSGSSKATLTRTGAVVGTVGYMAPEQARGSKDVDARADVFSLGCVLFEALTGTAAYAGPSPLAVLSKLLQDEIPRPSALRGDVPDDLDELVLLMLSKDPSRRPADLAVLAEQVAQLAQRAHDGGESGPRRGPSAAVPDVERRAVSLLYARGDALLEKAIPELARAFDGEVEKLPEDTWLVAFKSGHSAMDRTQHAAACALALRDSGLSRAALVTSRADTDARSQVGPALERGLALLAAELDAPVATVLIDDVTSSLVESTFELETNGSFVTLVARKADFGSGRLLMGQPTPFVGREKDLSILNATLEDCLEENAARVSWVTAAPGLGKSRLLSEFVGRIRSRGDVKLLRARGEVGAGAPLALVRQLVRSGTGAARDLSTDEQASRLEAAVAEVCTAERARPVAEFLAELLALELPGTASPALRAARADPESLATLLPGALAEWLDAERAKHCLVITIDDLHWVDVSSVELLVRCVRRGKGALFVLVASRPEGIEMHRALASLDATHVLRLVGLGARSAARLVKAVVPSLADDDVERLVELADGNAFFLEELIRARASGRTSELPQTVLAVAESRLDSLEPAARRVLRAASVVGERFEVAALEGIVGDAALVDEWLDILTQREFLVAATDTRVGRELSFRHALLREAAYSQLASDERRALHAVTARWLEQQAQADPVRLANHWELAGEASHAVTWITRAAEAALDASDADTARKLTTRGFALGASGMERGKLKLVERASATSADEAFRAASEAVELFPDGSDRRFQALTQALFAGIGLGGHGLAELLPRAIAHVEGPLPPTAGVAFGLAELCAMLIGAAQHPLAERVLQRFEAIAGGSEGEPIVLAHLFATQVFVRLNCRDSLEGALTAGRAAHEFAKQVGTARAAYVGHFPLGLALAFTGAFDVARAMLDDALAKLRGTFYESYVTASLVFVLEQAGQHEGAEQLAKAPMERGGMDGLSVGSMLLSGTLGARRAADATRLAAMLDARAAPFPGFRAMVCAAQAAAALAASDNQRALELTEEGLQGARVGYAAPWLLASLRLSRAKALMALARLPEARVAIREARERILATRDSIEDLSIRAGYVSAFADARETLSLANEWEAS
jgi:hypothetical protein